MADFYDDMQAAASTIIGEFAQGTVEYVEFTAGAGPADDPGPSTQTVNVLNAVVRGVSFKYLNKTDIQSSDLEVTFAGGGVVPHMDGSVRIDGVSHKIVQIDRKPAAGTVAAYTVIVRS